MITPNTTVECKMYHNDPSYSVVEMMLTNRKRKNTELLIENEGKLSIIVPSYHNRNID
jgi:hypothetical protein